MHLRAFGSIHSDPTVFCRVMDRSIRFGQDRSRDPKGHVGRPILLPCRRSEAISDADAGEIPRPWPVCRRLPRPPPAARAACSIAQQSSIRCCNCGIEQATTWSWRSVKSMEEATSGGVRCVFCGCGTAACSSCCSAPRRRTTSTANGAAPPCRKPAQSF
jgi:hypothetical protein